MIYKIQKLPGGPVMRTLHFHFVKGAGSVSNQRTKILQASVEKKPIIHQLNSIEPGMFLSSGNMKWATGTKFLPSWSVSSCTEDGKIENTDETNEQIYYERLLVSVKFWFI